jgi:ATP-dependent DNA ligase
LNRHADNETLREVVRLALDPLTQFYQRKIPTYVTGQPTMELKHGLNRLFPLASRMVTGHAAIAHLTETLSSLSADDAKVIERIIQKDLRCGVSVSTANKVWPDLVMDYPCMLCSQFEQKLVDKIAFPAYVQMKMDGMRFNAIVRNGGVEFRSRNGKELNLLGELETEFLALANGVDCVFDGELMVMLNGDHQFADRQTGNGILNKANKGTISPKEAKMVHASLWDVIPYDDFVKGICNVPYETRWSSVEHLVASQPAENKRIWTVFHAEVHNMELANNIFQQLLADGYEGIILKSKQGKWEDKRTKSQIKFKGELECDLKCVGVQAGTGKYEGMMGALLLESEDGIIKVSCGSGFNDEHRTTIGDEVIGKIIAVKYNARIVNKQGEHSLFLPIFLEVREDKDTADLSKDIK